MSPALAQQAIQLACRRGISFQAAAKILRAGDSGGGAAPPSTPSPPARAATGPADRVNPSPATGTRTPVHIKGKADTAELSLPPAPPPAEAPERPERVALAEAMKAWLAANPVRREPDWGELQEAYRVLRSFGYTLARAPKPARGPQYFLINGGGRYLDKDVKAKAAQLLRGGP